MMTTRRDPQSWTRRAQAAATATSASSTIRLPPPSPSLSLDGQRQQRQPLALEDQLEIPRHNFAPTNRPAQPPATTTMTKTTSDGAGVVSYCRCWGGIDNDDNATMAATMATPWRNEEQQRRQPPATQER